MTTFKTTEQIMKETVNKAIELINNSIANDEISTRLYESLELVMEKADELEMFLDTDISFVEEYESAKPFLTVTLEYLADSPLLMELLHRYTFVEVKEYNGTVVFVVD